MKPNLRLPRNDQPKNIEKNRSLILVRKTLADTLINLVVEECIFFGADCSVSRRVLQRFLLSSVIPNGDVFMYEPLVSSTDWYWTLCYGALFSSLGLQSLDAIVVEGDGMEGGGIEVGVEPLDPDRLRLRYAGASFSAKRSLATGS